MDKINIIYILSNGHSGSTLTDLLIGLHPEVSSIGEIKKFHSYVNNGSQLCTCGEAFSECPHWNNIFEGLDHDYSFSIDQRADFMTRNSDLLRSILKHDRTNWISDSSKTTSRLDLLLESDVFNVFILHLIRDGRAVAYSQVRKRSRLDNGRFNLKSILNYNYPSALRNWKKSNLAIAKKYGHLKNYKVLKYEDLVGDYKHEIGQLWKIMNLDSKPDYFDQTERSSHIVGGNRMRFDKNLIIKNDNKYKSKINSFVYMLSTYYISKTLQYFRKIT